VKGRRSAATLCGSSRSRSPKRMTCQPAEHQCAVAARVIEDRAIGAVVGGAVDLHREHEGWPGEVDLHAAGRMVVQRDPSVAVRPRELGIPNDPKEAALVAAADAVLAGIIELEDPSHDAVASAPRRPVDDCRDREAVELALDLGAVN
jgi:hypothetical protein